MVVADRLKITDDKVIEMTPSQFARWIAYINLENERESKAPTEARDHQITSELRQRIMRKNRQNKAG